MGPNARLREVNDPALWAVIDAPDDRTREAAIEALVVTVVDPLLAAIRKRFRRTETDLHDDMEDLSATIAYRLIRKVRAAAIDEEHAIRTLEGYVWKLAYNALHDFRRRRYPERYRLKRNLRYIMTRDPAFAVWEIAEVAVAGLARWKSRPAETRPTSLTRFTATAVMTDRRRPVEALKAILERIGHPVAFESLIDLVAELWDVREMVIESGDFPADERRDPLSSVVQRQSMESLWLEIRELPANQRTALLLNLRDSTGSNALTLFLLLNVTDLAGIATAIGMTVEEVNAVWDQLPLEDLAIADRLKLSRQQIINLRKSARFRLARRMAKWK